MKEEEGRNDLRSLGATFAMRPRQWKESAMIEL